jgi:lipopolysaccharide export system permease protein
MIEFKQQDLMIPLENYAFQKSDTSRFDDEVKSMNLKQLHHGQDSIGNLNAAAMASNIKGLMNTRSLRFHNQLDSAVVASRSSHFTMKEGEGWDDFDKEINALSNAKNNAEEMQVTLSSYSRERFHYTFTLRRIDIEILKKFALSVACLIFFFIGAPLGALIRKGGLGTPAIISVLFFVAYWVIDISGTKLARDGAVGPFHGVFISSYILLPT